MRVALLANHTLPGHGSVLGDVLRLLRGWGVKVDVLLPGSVVALNDLQIRSDVYLLKSVNDALVSLAAALEAAGAVCVNPTSVVRLTRDRIATAGALAAFDVPVPQSWSAQRLPDLAHLLDDGALVLRGGRVGSPVNTRVLWDLDDLLDVPPSREPWLVQRYHPSQHRARKIYRIGEQVFGVKRHWPVRTLADKIGEPFSVDAATHAVTDKLVAALGTDLFGADIVLTDDGPLVVDVHSFPGFKGVPNGALRLADYIYATANQAGERRAATQGSVTS